MKNTREMLGKQLTAARTSAQLSVPELALKMKTSRSHIGEMEAGKKNFTATLYDKLLAACSTSAEKAFEGMRTSDIPIDHEDLYSMLGVIVKGGDKDLLFGLRITLAAVSEKAIRLAREQKRKKTG